MGTKTFVVVEFLVKLFAKRPFIFDCLNNIMLREIDEVYQVSLDVLSKLLGNNQLTEKQYWNAIRALPLIAKHPSELSTEEELTLLFTFGSVRDLHPDYMSVGRILKIFGLKAGELFLIVRNAMNIGE